MRFKIPKFGRQKLSISIYPGCPELLFLVKEAKEAGWSGCDGGIKEYAKNTYNATVVHDRNGWYTKIIFEDEKELTWFKLKYGK